MQDASVQMHDHQSLCADLKSFIDLMHPVINVAGCPFNTSNDLIAPSDVNVNTANYIGAENLIKYCTL